MNDSIVPVTKRCAKCGEDLPDTATWFYAKSRTRGLDTQCKECRKAQSRERHRNPEKYRRLSAGESLCVRFWRNVPLGIKPDQCWEWMGTRQEDLYDHGTIVHGGRSINAHRISWILNRGPIPDGLWVLHKCDNPPCVNPAHLFLGTNQDNIRDCIAKDRHTRGERIAWHRLSESDVREILRRHAGGARVSALARDYNYDIGNMSAIVRRKIWKHVKI